MVPTYLSYLTNPPQPQSTNPLNQHSQNAESEQEIVRLHCNGNRDGEGKRPEVVVRGWGV